MLVDALVGVLAIDGDLLPLKAALGGDYHGGHTSPSSPTSLL